MKRLLALTALTVAILSTSPLKADETANPDEWRFTLAPYVWAAGIEGESGLFGFAPQDVEIGFTDVLRNLQFTFSAVGEARKGPFSISLDLLYVGLKTDIDTPYSIATNSIEAHMQTFMLTGLIGYSLIDQDGMTVDAMAGARLWIADNDFEFKGGPLGGRTPSDGATWVDPVLGGKVKMDLDQDFYLAGWALVGGFGAASDFMWDVMGGVGYRFNESQSVFLGYRAMGDDFAADGFVSDIVQSGPILGGSFSF